MMVDGVEESQLKGPIDVSAPYTSRYSSPNSWLHALVETATAVLVQLLGSPLLDGGRPGARERLALGRVAFP